MNNKLKLQDFTFLINVIKNQKIWNIPELVNKLNTDVNTLIYMLNIMSEVYSVNGENFIDFDIDLTKNIVSFDYSVELKDLETITALEMFFDEKGSINKDDYLSIFLGNEINIEYMKIGRSKLGTYSIKPISLSNNADGNILEAIDLLDNKVKTFLVNRILSVDDIDLSKSKEKDKSKNIDVKFNIYSEKSISKLNKDKLKVNDDIYSYLFRDYYVAMEYFFENYKDVEIISPKILKDEIDKSINKLKVMVSK